MYEEEEFNMADPKIVVYIDILSAFSYMVFYVVNTHPVFASIRDNVTFIPVRLPLILKATANSPPLEIKNKGDYIRMERGRWCEQFGIPWAPDDKFPDPFPAYTGDLLAMLALVGVEDQEKAKKLTALAWDHFFVKTKPVEKIDQWWPIVGKVLSEDEARELKPKITKDGKALLKENTARAVEDGAFGLPWILATNSKGETEKYWGFDNLAQVAMHVGLERPQPEGPWKAML